MSYAENAKRATVNSRLVTPKWDQPFHGFKMPSPNKPLERQQHLYVIRSLAAGDLIKIGVANDLKTRLKALEAGNPHGLELLDSRLMPRVLAFQVERRVHAHFEDRALGREWFRLTAEEVMPVVDRWARKARAALKYHCRLNGLPEA